MTKIPPRRTFLKAVGLGAAAFGLPSAALSKGKKDSAEVIQGFDETIDETGVSEGWQPVSDRKIRIGIAGYGSCRFGAAFSFQDHPNVEIVAVTDLLPDRCANLAKAVRCEKKYPSLEEMVKDDNIEAVFVATDAPSHARHALEALKHGKHVATAVPACYESLEDGEKLFEAVKTTGLKYMMFETSCFHADCYAMHKLYEAGIFGEMIYSEGEYYHYMPKPILSYKDWRVGLPPQYYPTHSNAYHICVTGGSFTEVSCMAMPSIVPHLQAANNRYKNPFGTETALFRTSEGGASRMIVSWDTPGKHGEMGRVRGQKGTFYGKFAGEKGVKVTLPDLKRPPLPPGVKPGGHGGSHGQLMNEFVLAILENRKPLVDIAKSLNMSVAGIVAHQSAMADGELMKIPQYKI